MDKRKFKKVLATSVIGAFILVGGTVAIAAPGDEADPFVTVGYIESNVIPKIQQYIDSKLAGLNGGNSDTSGNTSAPSFKVVEVKNGQSLIAAEGCEMILRMGSGTIIATEKGGIADTTIGTDLANGSEMPSNHLLIVPLADGRGFTATSDVLVMVKGGYTIN